MANEYYVTPTAYTCSECGHLHYTAIGYLRCPLYEECYCKMNDEDIING